VTIFQHFVKTVGIYPVGALVRLKSERLGVVVEQDETSLLHPKVKVFLSTRTRMPFEPEIINLASPAVQDGIVKFELAEDWGLLDVNSMWAGQPAA
jgi:hypothetical protein